VQELEDGEVSPYMTETLVPGNELELRRPVASPVRATIGLAQAVALYLGAILGAGVLILPGVTASEAGPAAILSWTFIAVLGLPLALTFARLAKRSPD